MTISDERKNVAILAFAQALFYVGQVTVVTFTGLAGAMLAEVKALATLPVSAVVVAAALTTIPASLLMKRVGRRHGFMLGAAIGLVGALICAYALWVGDFWLFCVGGFVYGINGGFSVYYRFAAADSVNPVFRPKAISYVVSGGILAAIVGPQLAIWANGQFSVTFFGAYILVAAVAMSIIFTLLALNVPNQADSDVTGAARPLSVIARQPAFIVAVLVGMVGYSSMTLIMTAAPLAMVGHGMQINDAAFVIQWHVLAMFVPALFSGYLIQRLGVLTVMISGLFLLLFSVTLGLGGLDIVNFWLSLVTLGLGWNFTFVGASSLITETYKPAEGAKVQAANDFAVFGSVALSSLFSGALQHFVGWTWVLLIDLPFLAVAGVATVALIVARRRQRLST